jgi:hypothetical protein
MFRPDSQSDSYRRDELYVDRRFICNSNTDDTCIIEYNDVYGNRNAEYLYGNSYSYGNGYSIAKCYGDLTKHLFRFNSDLTGKRCDELYMDRRVSGNGNTDHTDFNDNDDLYSNRHNGYLQ